MARRSNVVDHVVVAALIAWAQRLHQRALRFADREFMGSLSLPSGSNASALRAARGIVRC